MPSPGPQVLVVERADVPTETAARIEDAIPDVTTVTAESIPDALAVVEERRVDCVVSDYEIPDGSGYMMEGGQRLLEAVRERNESLPFVLFTEIGNDAVARKAVVAGVTDYVWRYDTPAAYDRLTERVENAIETYRTERRADSLKRLNETIRTVHQEIVRATTIEGIDDAVTTCLLEERLYEHAAIGDAVDGTFEPRATASLDGEPFDWGTVAVTDDQYPVVATTPGDLTLAVVPIETEGSRGGYLVLLTTRPDAFEETERGVLAELGRTVAYARWAVDTRSQLRERERELKEQNDRLEHFASAVSHDLRNPLQVAKGHLMELSRQTDSEHVSTVEGSLDRMEELIEDVLMLARGGEQELDPRGVDLGAVVRDAWSGTATGEATLDVASALGTIEADRSQLRRLLTNLFTNAVEHGTPDTDVPEADPGAALTIRAERIDDGFAVADDGVGIPESDRDGLFELGHTSGAGNTGMGLAIVAEIADAHGWTVSVTESTEGGARFEIGSVSFV